MFPRIGLVLGAVLLAACSRQGAVSPSAISSDAPREYTIQWGDTLEDIAWKFDVEGGYPALAELNALRNPHWIGAGNHLTIPPTPAARERLPAFPAPQREQPSFKACATTAMPAPMETAISGCTAAACVPLPRGRQVCACEGGPEAQGIHVFNSGHPQLDWPVRFSSLPGDEWERQGTVRDFEVSQVQLDDDPELEIAVATLTTKNDLGMSWWDVAILDGPDATQAVRLEIANFGRSSFVAAKGDRCQLLASTWEIDRRPGSEGFGYYFTGRAMSVNRGELVPDRQQPLWMRRLLYSFEPGTLAMSTGLPLGTPAQDLAAAATETRAVEPFVRAERLRDFPVNINASRSAQRTEAGQVHLLTDQGTLITGSGSRFLRLGDQRTGRLFPPSYRPAASLTGRSAVLSEYAGGWGNVRRVLWLSPAT